MTTTRRARKRPAESLCHPPSPPARANEATTFAPRPRALKRPVLPPSQALADRGPEPVRRGLPPALRTAVSTCFKNGWVRGLTRAPLLRDRPGRTRKFSLSSLAMTRRLASERAPTRPAEHRSRQIASTRTTAKKQRRPRRRALRAPSLGILKSNGKFEGRHPRTLHEAKTVLRQPAKTNVQTKSSRQRTCRKICERQFALSCRHSQCSSTGPYLSPPVSKVHRGSVSASAASAEQRVPALGGVGGWNTADGRSDGRRWNRCWERRSNER